jgi:predicted nucleic acid-binding Zn ribbon protein
MAKKRLGYVDLEWTCPACGNRNMGTTKTCASCGAAMPEDADFALPTAQQVDTSAETAAQVASGPDVLCPYCGARNRGDAQECVQCGGDLSDAARRKTGAVVGALATGPASEIACPHCGAKNPATALKCSQCGGALVEAAEPPRAPPRQRRIIPWILGGFALVVLVLILLNRGGSERLGVVSDVQWTYTVGIEELKPAEQEAWREQVPKEGRVISCAPKVRRTSDQPVVGAVEVCGTPYVVDTGTGKGEVQQDCVYQISDDWCRFSLLTWQKGEALKASGHDYAPYWPSPNLDNTRREAGREEVYQVFLAGDGDQYIYRPDSLQEFERFQVGGRWTVKPNAFGGVMSIRPAE